MDFLKVYQIHFDKSQLTKLERDYIPYYNKECSIYFENDVIIKLINEGAHRDCEYFAVVSYKLREKIGRFMKHAWASLPNIANHSFNEFEPERFEAILKEQRPDVMSFQRHIPHDTVMFADNFHPEFSNFFAEIITKIGLQWQPEIIKNVFYCNFFAAKAEIYERYVTEVLIPAKGIMDGMPELMNNSRYPHKLPIHLSEKLGFTHYPYHPFLCERLFSYFVHINNFKCLHF